MKIRICPLSERMLFDPREIPNAVTVAIAKLPLHVMLGRGEPYPPIFHNPNFCFLILGNSPASKITLVTITAHNLICNLQPQSQHSLTFHLDVPLSTLSRNAVQKERSRGNHSRRHIKSRLRSRTHRHQSHDHNQVSTHPVIFVHALRIVNSTIQARSIVLRYAHDSLDGK